MKKFALAASVVAFTWGAGSVEFALAQSAKSKGVPDGYRLARTGDFTSKKGYEFKGYNPAVVGGKCLTEPTIHKEEWGTGVYKKYRYEWTAVQQEGGVVKCTDGRVTQYESGWNTKMGDFYIVNGKPYTKNEWF